MAWYNPLSWGGAVTTAGTATANPWIAGAGLALQTIPYALKAGAWGIDKFRRKRNPYQYQRNRTLSQMNVTPEAYELQKQNLQQGLAYLQNRQNIVQPQEARMRQSGNIAASVPAQVENVDPAQPLSGLPALLRNMQQAGQRGYQQDVGAYQSQMGRRLGYGSSNVAGALQDLYLNRAQQTGQNQLQALANYARQNAITDIEGRRLAAGQGQAQNQLDEFIGRLGRGEQGLAQQDYLQQQQRGQNVADIFNQYNQQRYRQGVQQYQIGNQPAFNVQQQRR